MSITHLNRYIFRIVKDINPNIKDSPWLIYVTTKCLSGLKSPSEIMEKRVMVKVQLCKPTLELWQYTGTDCRDGQNSTHSRIIIQHCIDCFHQKQSTLLLFCMGWRQQTELTQLRPISLTLVPLQLLCHQFHFFTTVTQIHNLNIHKSYDWVEFNYKTTLRYFRSLPHQIAVKGKWWCTARLQRREHAHADEEAFAQY